VLFRSGGPEAATLQSHSLPFSVRLDSFEIDRYAGTWRPAMYRSRVFVEDRAAARSFPAIIQMNHELSYGGYKFFQSSFHETPGRDQTVLSVSRDPGQTIVFIGYVLLMVGMITVLATRIAQNRALARATQPPAGGPLAGGAAGIALTVMMLLAAAPGARAATAPDPGTLEALRRLPVQHDGRVMPLDTVAREAVWQVTGRQVWEGRDPVELVLGWTFDPVFWEQQRIVRIDAGLAEAAGLPAGTRRASFHDLVQSARVMELMRQADMAAEKDMPVMGLVKEAQKAEERLLCIQGFKDRSRLTVIPPPPAKPGSPPRGQAAMQGQPPDAWTVPPALGGPADLVAAGRTQPPDEARDRLITAEIRYNRVRPSRLAWWILVAAMAASLLAGRLQRTWIDAVAIGGLAAGFLLMTWGLVTRWQIAGRIPASNMYESLLFLAWGVGLFALVAMIFLRNRLVVLNAAAMSALTMMLTDLLPIDPFVHPVMPVLSGTYWLAIHVPIIMISYSVLALGVFAAHLQVGLGIFAPSRRDLIARMGDLLYWYIHIGSILLIAGILTGSIWAASSWGRYWGWDPKEVWSLVAFLAYLAILHGRLDRILGSFGVAAVSIVAFWMIIMTYVGVNFVLASGLHSYGFGSSSVVRWLLIVGGAETAFLIAGFLTRHRLEAFVVAPSATAR
jgi:cytochrome c-type biogenesis protein CcsB